MKKTLVDTIKEVGEEADMKEYRETEGETRYEESLVLKSRVADLESLVEELRSLTNYHRAEIASNRAMVLKLAEIIDEDRDPTKPIKGFE